MLTGLLPLVVAVAMANVVGAGAEAVTKGFDSDAGDHFVVAVAVFGVLFVVQPVLTVFGDAYMRRVGRRLDGALRDRVMAAALVPRGIAHLEDPTMKQAFDAARTVSAAGFTPGSAAEVLPAVIGPRVRSAAYGLALLWVWWPLGLAVLAAQVFTHSEMAKVMQRRGARSSQATLPLAVPNYYRDLATTPRAAKEVRVFGLGGWLRGRFDSALATAFRNAPADPGIFGEFHGSMAAMVAGNAAVSLGGLTWLGFAARRGDASVADLAFAVGALLALRPDLALMDFILNAGTRGVESVDDAVRHSASLPTGSGGPIDAADMPGTSIRFDDVHFRYPGGTSDVLRGVDLELRPGETVAVVGSNGAGKTTLVKLLCGFYELTGGSISVDGVALADLNAQSWRKQLAVLFQDFVHYDLPARDNVGFGAVRLGAVDDDRLRRAAAPVGADRIIERLPAGWDTPLSAQYAGGTELSGGEWQRVAFARALLAVDAGARVVVLDEPTANLDVRAESELYETIRGLTVTGDSGYGHPLVTLLISHRLSAVRQADRILVLADGRIAEDGTHDQLIALGGLYREMFQAQAARFTETGEDVTVDETVTR